MFVLVVFLVGFFLGAIAVLGLEALGVLYVINKLTQKTRKLEQSLVAASKDDDNLQYLDFAYPKQGDIWVLEPESVPKNWSEKISREHERKKKFFEVFPVRKHATVKDHWLILTESDGSPCAIQLKGCVIEAVSATHLPSRKWAKKFPIKLSKTSVIYKGSRTLYLYLDTSWDKESWCKALRLASCEDHIQLSWFSNLQKEFKTYLNTLQEGYPSFMKPQSGFYAEPIDKENRTDSSSKVRVMWKKLARKMSKYAAENNKSSWVSLSAREEKRMNERLRGHQDSVSTTISGRATPVPGLSPLCSSLPHSGSQSQASVISDTDFDDRVSVDEGTLCWNLLISRLFFDVKNSEKVRKSIQDRIQRSISNMRIPSYIGEVICTNINLGNLPPHVHSARVLPLDMNEIWAFEVDLEYSGGFVLDIETRIEVQELDRQQELVDPNAESNSVKDVSAVLLEEFEQLGNQFNLSVEKSDGLDQKGDGDTKSEGSTSSKSNATASAPNVKSRWKSLVNSVAKHVSQVPISLRIRVASIRGTVRLHIKPPPSDQLWFCFTSMPEIEFNLESSVGEHKITNSRIALYLINRFKASIRDTMVSPNSESVWIPFMVAEKDDWVPRKTAPFIWLNQEPAPALEKPSPSQSADVRPNTTPTQEPSRDPTESRHQKPKPTPTKCEQTQTAAVGSLTDASSTSTEILRQSQSLQDLTTPLLMENNEDREERVASTEIPISESPSMSVSGSPSRSVSGSPSRSVSMSSVGTQSNLNLEDDGKPKKIGRRGRMLDLGKKMSEKIEEKRRHIEEKGRNIVEKMRAQ